MWIKNNANSGIKGMTVPGFKFTDCLIQNNTNATGEQAGILINDLSDANAQVSRVEVSGSTEDNVRIHNSTVTGTINLSNCTVKDNSTASGNNGVFFQTNTTGNLTGTVQNSTFSGNRTISLSADSGDGSVLSATFTGNTIRWLAEPGQSGHPGFPGLDVDAHVRRQREHRFRDDQHADQRLQRQRSRHGDG